MVGCLVVWGFLIWGQSAHPLQPGWVADASFASRHATQAAAADERHLYAISNTHVAKHRRADGMLLSLTTSPGTRHLNSGFFHKGKLYCAHSNYPNLPEESDIRVYDPEKETFSVFHTFVNPPGSLVWCVRDPSDECWWCCFAHYGSANAKSFLARMDNQFRIQQRWSFPPKVVDDWDQMSASGGIWDGETLLVSHHHFRVLYRLRLPRMGNELEWVESLGCPFPGQGIAVDPLHPRGLVGIDRSRGTVVLARPTEKEKEPPKK